VDLRAVAYLEIGDHLLFGLGAFEFPLQHFAAALFNFANKILLSHRIDVLLGHSTVDLLFI
jgi:hypothetical protein